jgi:hypothetical protein
MRKKKPGLIALVDCIGVAGNKMGVILGLDTKIEDLENVFKWVSQIQAPPGTTIETVTLVKPHSKPIKEYYVHPQMADQTNKDGSVNTPQGPLWLELVFALNQEEE